MLQLIKKYCFLFILVPIFMYSINLNAKILYDKSGIIITDLDLNNYINLSIKLDQIKLDRSGVILKTTPSCPPAKVVWYAPVVIGKSAD